MQSTGVTVIVAGLVVAAVGVISSGVKCADGIHDELLPLPSETSQLRADMLQTLRQETSGSRIEPDEMLEQLARLAKTAPGLYERAFYREMRKLGEEGTGACNTLTMRYIYEIVSLSNQHNDLLALTNYINFLKTYGKAKFAECAATTEDLFNERMSSGRRRMKQPEIFQNIENGLDLFFMAYAGSKHMLDDTHLYEVAKKVDLARDEFKVNRMLKVAKTFRLRTGEADPVKLLIEFLVDSCAGLQRPLNVVFGNYNIARALGAQLPSELPMRFLKLNEYNRICVVFQNEKGKKEARTNMERQLNAMDTNTNNNVNTKTNTNTIRQWFKL